jgi:hypothetical protein
VIWRPTTLGKQGGQGRQEKVEGGEGNSHGPATAPCDAWSEDLLFCDCGRNGQQNRCTLARYSGSTTALASPSAPLHLPKKHMRGSCGKDNVAAMQEGTVAAARTGVADPPTGAAGAAVTPGIIPHSTRVGAQWLNGGNFDQQRPTGPEGARKRETRRSWV